MSAISEQVDGITDGFDDVIAEFYAEADKALVAASEAGDWAVGTLEAIQAELNVKRAEVELKMAEIRAMAPSKERAELLGSSVLSGVNFVAAKYGSVATAIDAPLRVANQSLEAASDFLDTFKENPGRRLISLWLGALMGLAVAGFLGLDVFQAVLGEQAGVANLGVAITGLVIGLGASPAHEVVKILQEVKKSRTSENAEAPTVA